MLEGLFIGGSRPEALRRLAPLLAVGGLPGGRARLLRGGKARPPGIGVAGRGFGTRRAECLALSIPPGAALLNAAPLAAASQSVVSGGVFCGCARSVPRLRNQRV